MKIKPIFSGLLILSLLFCLGLTNTRVSAQADEKEKAQKEIEQRQALERNTLLLLDEVVSGAWSLKVPENRAFVLANAADLLWTRDEKRARNLFLEALNNLDLPISMPAADEPAAKDAARKEPAKAKAVTPTKEQMQTLNQYYEAYQKRREFLRKVAKRDPQLALDILRTMVPRPPKQMPDTFQLPDERDL